jgi:hypothetical protein
MNHIHSFSASGNLILNWANYLTGSLDNGCLWPTLQNLRPCQRITNSTCPDINAELLLVFRLEYIVSIVLYLLVMVIKVYAAAFTKTCLA